MKSMGHCAGNDETKTAGVDPHTNTHKRVLTQNDLVAVWQDWKSIFKSRQRGKPNDLLPNSFKTNYGRYDP